MSFTASMGRTQRPSDNGAAARVRLKNEQELWACEKRINELKLELAKEQRKLKELRK